MMEPVELLTRMVEIKSLSGEERALAEFLVQQMQTLGFVAHIDEAGNAVGIKGAGNDAETTRDIVLLGHMDTVPGDVPVRREESLLYGRGSVDAKGPLATFICAAAQTKVKPGTRLVVIGAVEEESATSKGARHVATQYSPAFCIIGEPSGWDAATLGYKGRLLVDYRLQCEVGHTAGPEGSAADEFCAWWRTTVDYCASFNQEHQRLFDQILPTLRTVNSDNDGLTDAISAVASFRLPPDFAIEPFKRRLQESAKTAQVHCYAHEQAFASTRRTPLASAFNKAFRQAGVLPKFKLKTGTADMNVVGPVWQCPILAYGPGDSNLDHTPQEHICIEEYQRAIAILREVLAQLQS